MSRIQNQIDAERYRKLRKVLISAFLENSNFYNAFPEEVQDVERLPTAAEFDKAVDAS